MGDVAIKYKPNVSASNTGAPKRDNMKFTVSWKVPSSATNKKSNRRWTWQYAEWRIWYADARDAKRTAKEWKSLYWLKWWTNLSGGSHSYTLKRSDFYPNTNWILTHVEVAVGGWNKKGYGPWKRYSFKSAIPDKATLSKSISSDTQAVTFTVKNTDPGASSDRKSVV